MFFLSEGLRVASGTIRPLLLNHDTARAVVQLEVQQRVGHADEEDETREEGSVERAQEGNGLQFEGDPGAAQFDLLELPGFLLDQFLWLLVELFTASLPEIRIITLLLCRVKLLILHCPLL